MPVGGDLEYIDEVTLTARAGGQGGAVRKKDENGRRAIFVARIKVTSSDVAKESRRVPGNGFHGAESQVYNVSFSRETVEKVRKRRPGA